MIIPIWLFIVVLLIVGSMSFFIGLITAKKLFMGKFEDTVNMVNGLMGFDVMKQIKGGSENGLEKEGNTRTTDARSTSTTTNTGTD